MPASPKATAAGAPPDRPSTRVTTATTTAAIPCTATSAPAARTGPGAAISRDNGHLPRPATCAHHDPCAGPIVGHPDGRSRGADVGGRIPLLSSSRRVVWVHSLTTRTDRSGVGAKGDLPHFR